MKHIFLFVAFLSMAMSAARAQQDTMYIVLSGGIISQYPVSEIDSIVFAKPTAAIDSIMSDIDGNAYKVIKIGDQIWMAENLRTLTLNDGTEISEISGSYDWQTTSEPALCWYNNNESATGPLYNWYVVNTEKLCPAGWHVPSDVEWTVLEDYLVANSYNYDGSIISNKIGKSLASISGWASNSLPGTVGNDDYPQMQNLTGFNALPTGYRLNNGNFYQQDNYAGWWSSSLFTNGNTALFRRLYSEVTFLYRANNYLNNGFNVRCIKN